MLLFPQASPSHFLVLSEMGCRWGEGFLNQASGSAVPWKQFVRQLGPNCSPFRERLKPETGLQLPLPDTTTKSDSEVKIFPERNGPYYYIPDKCMHAHPHTQDQNCFEEQRT